MSRKKIIFIVSFLVIFSFLFNFNLGAIKAMTAEEIQNIIKQLQQQIAELQKQLAMLEGKETAWCYGFNVNLKIGMDGSDVRALHIALEKEGFAINSEEKNNNRFDEATASAVSGFQEKYRDEILTPLGLKFATGYVGKSTRAKLNQLYGCGIAIEKPVPIPTLTPIPMPPVCIQVITPALDPITGACKNFPTPCEVPSTWKKISSCPTAPLPTPTSTPTPTPTPSVPSTSSINILYPNGREVLQKGTIQTIKWNSNGVSKIYIKLRKGTDTYPGTEGMVSDTIPNAGFFQWTVPSTLPDNNSYAIRVIDAATNLLDDSDGPFIITTSTTEKTCTQLEPSQKIYFNGCSDSGYDNVCFNKFTGEYQGCTKNIRNDCSQSNYYANENILCPVAVASKTITVVYPNGGETWEIGKTYPIKWSTTGYSSDAVVRIIVAEENSGTENPIFNVYNTGGFSWTIPPDTYKPLSNYKIKIVAPDEKYDKSDSPFSIISGATGLKNIENQLADISIAVSKLIEEIKTSQGR